jgi:hypothetical protein
MCEDRNQGNGFTAHALQPMLHDAQFPMLKATDSSIEVWDSKMHELRLFFPTKSDCTVAEHRLKQ